MASAGQAFLLSADLDAAVVERVVAFAVDPDSVTRDTVSFAEGGGDVDLALAVPFLAGMDEVVVNSARLVLRAVDTDVTVDGWHTTPGPGGFGAFVVLTTPAQLRRLVLDVSGQPVDAFPVIRSATLDEAGTPHAGPPIFAGKAFSTGPMFPAPLAGLAVVSGPSGRMTLSLPATQGQAWLVQFATGDSPAGLSPAAIVPSVRSLTVAPAASEVTLTLRAPAGSAEPGLALWGHPGPLLTDAGEQEADFTPAASQSLSAVLAALNASHGSAALSLPLRFHAATAGTLAITRRVLDVRYRARPVGAPLTLALDGGWVELVLNAPVHAPDETRLRLSARHRGIAVNPGSGIPPSRTPSAGFRVGAGRQIAAAVPWQPPGSAGGPGTPELAVLRLLVYGVGAAEIVGEVRADAAGAPGALIAGPLVGQLRGDDGPGWVSLPLPNHQPVPAPATLWVTVRMNLGELDWLALPGGHPVLASTDGGISWGPAETPLVAHQNPVIQLMHLVDPAQRHPTLTVRNAETDRGTISLAPVATPVADSGEYAGPVPPTLPDAMLVALSAADAAGPARRDTTFSLWSADAMELTVAELNCSYDPFSDGKS